MLTRKGAQDGPAMCAEGKTRRHASLLVWVAPEGQPTDRSTISQRPALGKLTVTDYRSELTLKPKPVSLTFFKQAGPEGPSRKIKGQ